MKIIFESFNVEQNNDQIINNFLNENLLDRIDADRQDLSMRPLTERELRKIKLEKARAKPSGAEQEVCSICCDDISEKQRIRKMPECKHEFHQR